MRGGGTKGERDQGREGGSSHLCEVQYPNLAANRLSKMAGLGNDTGQVLAVSVQGLQVGSAGNEGESEPFSSYGTPSFPPTPSHHPSFLFPSLSPSTYL